MGISRRSFLKNMIIGSAITGGAFLTLKTLSLDQIAKAKPKTSSTQSQNEVDNTYPNPNDPNKAWGMIIDLNKCKGCGGISDEESPCTSACRKMHNVPPDQEWVKLYYKHDNPLQTSYYFPRLCMQCEDPPCRRVCPVGASLRRDKGDGLVLINQDVCIGCRLCIGACPYEARYFNWEEYDEPDKTILKLNSPMYVTEHQKGTTDKCDFCAHLAYKGKIAKCVKACPEGALYYGNLKDNAVTNSLDETLNVSETISKYGGYRYKEELGTRPRVYYIPVRGRES